jgi:CSLREA domain-containing protein
MRRRIALPALMLVAALGLWPALPAHAGGAITIHVTSTADLPDTNAGDSICHASNGKCTLRAAVQTANAHLGNAYRILLGAGTFTLTRGPTNEDAAAGGDLDLLGPVGIIGLGPGKTTVQMDSNKVQDRVFQVLGNFADRIRGMTITNGYVPGNDPKGDGGAIESEAISLTLQNDLITGNRASVSGGGVANQQGALIVSGTTFSGNIAQNNGGAIRGYDAVTLTNSSLIDNTAIFGDGGAIDSTDQLVAENVTIAGNTAKSQGGGIRGGTVVTLTNTTVTGNGADNGGNLGGGDTVTLTNSILADTAGGGNCHATVSADHSLFDHAGGCTITGSGNLIGEDPDLGALDHNGGSTETQPLLAGSPAIDAGTSSGCPSTDQRGVRRPQGPACDMGAYEVPVPVVTQPAAAAVHQSTFTVAWLVPGGKGAAKFDVRYRDHAVGHPPFGAFHSLLDHTPKHHAPFTAMFGFRYCFSARAVDQGGNLSPFGRERCVNVTH